MKAEAAAAPVALGDAAAGLQRIAAERPARRSRSALCSAARAPGSARARASRALRLDAGRRISPIPPALAAIIAEADHKGEQRARGSTASLKTRPNIAGRSRLGGSISTTVRTARSTWRRIRAP
jgi:hypothetical protein